MMYRKYKIWLAMCPSIRSFKIKISPKVWSTKNIMMWQKRNSWLINQHYKELQCSRQMKALAQFLAKRKKKKLTNFKHQFLRLSMRSCWPACFRWLKPFVSIIMFIWWWLSSRLPFLQPRSWAPVLRVSQQHGHEMIWFQYQICDSRRFFSPIWTK